MPDTPGLVALTVMPILLWLHYRNYRKSVQPNLGQLDKQRAVVVALLCGYVFIASAREGEWLFAILATAFILFVAWTCGGFHTARASVRE